MCNGNKFKIIILNQFHDGISSDLRGKFPLRIVPHEAFNIWMAASTVFWTSTNVPMAGFTSTISIASSLPVSFNFSTINAPSRNVNPPRTKISI